jgi:hypothetical protein
VIRLDAHRRAARRGRALPARRERRRGLPGQPRLGRQDLRPGAPRRVHRRFGDADLHRQRVCRPRWPRPEHGPGRGAAAVRAAGARPRAHAGAGPRPDRRWRWRGRWRHRPGPGGLTMSCGPASPGAPPRPARRPSSVPERLGRGAPRVSPDALGRAHVRDRIPGAGGPARGHPPFFSARLAAGSGSSPPLSPRTSRPAGRASSPPDARIRHLARQAGASRLPAPRLAGGACLTVGAAFLLAACQPLVRGGWR